jgi:hypothetical protein
VSATGGTPRGIFFDEDHARAALLALERDGWSAVLVRERLAGEDDDEDHPWAITSDAPEHVLDVLVDVYDGWLDHEESSPAPPPPPLDLPRAPRRARD